MNKSLKRGILFGFATSAFGTAAWALAGLFAGGLAEVPTAMTVGAVFCAAVGFAIGALGSDDQTTGTLRFAYRSVVGFLVGTVAASAVMVAGVGLGLAAHGNNLDFLGRTLRYEPPLVAIGAFTAASVGAMVGGIVGAWLGTGNGFRMSMWGSLAGILLGAAYGALLAAVWGLVPDTFGALLQGSVAAGGVGACLAKRLRQVRGRV